VPNETMERWSLIAILQVKNFGRKRRVSVAVQQFAE
jgi:hypothetical protein